jgi:hypothetical protein
MTPSEAMEIVKNPEDYSAAKLKRAKKVLKEYGEKTKADKSGGLRKDVPDPPRKKIMQPTPKPKKMASGGMANGKQHMYLSKGSFVTDKLPNKGLKRLAKSGPKGKQAVRKMGFNV